MNVGLESYAALFLVFGWLLEAGAGLGEVIWAVNCGGEAHTDAQGIAYQKDQIRVGVASDYGRSLQMIQRVLPHDQIIYQTERYHTTNFAYEVPIGRDGEYVLVLKFCEVWFTEPNQKVSYAVIIDIVLSTSEIKTNNLNLKTIYLHCQFIFPM